MTDTLATTTTGAQGTAGTTTGAQNTAGLHRAMRPRQLVMMSLGGAIGAGLFVGSGAGIAVAGPAILISFLVAAVLVVFVMRMMGEMAAATRPAVRSRSTPRTRWVLSRGAQLAGCTGCR